MMWRGRGAPRYNYRIAMIYLDYLMNILKFRLLTASEVSFIIIYKYK